jgi:predicted Zn-dependent protease
MKTDVSGLNAAKFQVKAHYASLSLSRWSIVFGISTGNQFQDEGSLIELSYRNRTSVYIR